MRVIAGIHRGRKLIGPADEKTTRPITDRVKENLFNRLWSIGLFPDDPFAALDEEDDSDVPAGPVLDVFSGTGSMGIEALSRGARSATFVDMDRDAVERLNRNFLELGIEDERAKIVQSNAMTMTWIDMLPERIYAMAFVDPPYRFMDHETHSDERARIVKMMSKLADVIHDEGIMILRLPELIGAPVVEGWGEPTPHHYGSMSLHFYEKA
ncbi:RsmD family RNA methyltransferase [Planctomycetota bacterium]|nr:RsmD family RNA methyltransferase [Planctomycetota bacterium]